MEVPGHDMDFDSLHFVADPRPLIRHAGLFSCGIFKSWPQPGPSIVVL